MQSLLLLGCCYHKTEHAQWQPMSREVQALMQSHGGSGVTQDTSEGGSQTARGQGASRDLDKPLSMHTMGLSKFGLRLASQETRHRCFDSS